MAPTCMAHLVLKACPAFGRVGHRYTSSGGVRGVGRGGGVSFLDAEEALDAEDAGLGVL